MENPSFHLFQLQKIDTQIDVYKRRLSYIFDLKQNNSEISTIDSEILKNKNEFELIETEISQVSEKISQKKIKIELSESSLYGGKVINPKELQDLQNEIALLKKAIEILEESQFKLLLQYDEKEICLKTLNIQKEEITNRINSQFSQFSIEEKEIESKLETVSHERNLIFDQIAEQYKITYDSLRKSHKGVAVTIIEEGSCSACGNTLTPSECQNAKSQSKMNFCPSCGRILYAG